MARQYRVRPATLLGLEKESDYVAFCFDEAVFHFGTHVEAEMNKAEAKAKTDQQRLAARIGVLQRILNDEGEQDIKEGGQVKQRKSGFADPASMLTKG